MQPKADAVLNCLPGTTVGDAGLNKVVTEGQRRPALSLAVWGLPLRNLLFLLLIMAHALRRVLPPY